MRKYRIKKYVDGNGTPIYYAQWRMCRIFWVYFKGMYDEVIEYDTIEKANEDINKSVKRDKSYQKKYKETFQCAVIPGHIPKDQVERFLKSKENKDEMDI